MARPDLRERSDGRSRAEVVEELKKKLAPTAPRQVGDQRPPIPSGWPELDRLLGGGLPRGLVIEVAGSAGRMSLAVAALAGATAAGHLAAIVDGPGALDPRALRDAGADLDSVLWCRPREQQLVHVLQIADLLLDADAFSLVVLYFVGVRGRVNSSSWLRLQQRATQRGAAVLLVADRPLAGSFSGATIELRQRRSIWHRVPGARLLLEAQEIHADLLRARWDSEGQDSVMMRLAR